ncbi:phosphoribosylformylglycinamidine synthase [uncultured Tyzzerella sp.]|uniref:phosphoribosylformylglycinamidine synthase n=1 Tax=uncultured Tyzzerella sp. TaxID=2321398 RepID=UPI002942F16A|nr:phosphoribosylformylglycinamidine synthase [uncultured Tyzzerella sp.]
MANIKRIFVEKKDGYNIEAKGLLKDFIQNLGIKSLENIRVLNRYDIQLKDEGVYQDAKNTIFSEPPVDIVFEENINLNDDEFMFAVEYLPGQYDQRADSAIQCISLITEGDVSLVKNAKVFILKGNLSSEEIEKVKSYAINPVDSREASGEKPDNLDMAFSNPDDVEILDGFIQKTEEELEQFRQELGLAMNKEDLILCRDYFKDTENRNPSITEIKMIDTYWSDHCRHTTFATKLNNIEIEEGFYKKPIEDAYNVYLEERKALYKDKQKDICLMDIAVMGMKALKSKGILKNLDESEEINACSIVVDVDVDGKNEEWLVMFKNETHNHPTEIEPFGGAATCLGGAIRDPLSGRSYVYQAMRVTGSADPTTEIKDTLPGKLPQRTITKTAAHGYSSYGNQIGLATGLVAEIYDEDYVAKRMEIGAVIGANKKENVIRNVPKKGDVVILTGGRTGRDGCGGATGSSKEHTEESINNCGAEVQKGNAPTERKLQRLFRNENVSKLIKRCNDFGAGGVSVAIGELSDGLDIDLDLVPKKYEGLDGTELAISESQERMAVVVEEKDVDKFIAFANEENLEAVVVAKVTDDRRLRMKWRGKEIVNLSRDFLDTNGATQNMDIFVKSPKQKIEEKEDLTNIKEKLLNNLKDLNVCSQKGLSEMFDSTIGTGTVLMPFGGENQLTPPEAMVCKIPVLKGETNTATIMSYGYNPKVAKWSPFHSAIYAVVESVSKIVATGGDYKNIKLTFQEYFEKLGNDKEKWGKPFSALIGALHAQLNLGIAAIGGKDSMSGTFKDMNVPPTLVSFALDVANVNNVISPEFKKEDNYIIKLNTKYDDYDLPIFDELTKNYEKINNLIKDKKVLSASTIGFGGASASISKMSLGNYIGANVSLNKDVFNYSYGSFILEVDKNVNIEKEFEGFTYENLGKTTKEQFITINNEKIDLQEIQKAWFDTLEPIFPTKYYDEFKKLEIDVKEYKVCEKRKSNISIAKPKVFIPVFPGTNCEYDLKRAFEKAGGDVETFVFKNLDSDGIKQSIEQMVKIIDKSQIVMIPGGFSAGDEPDGSGKFIASIFRNPRIKDSVMNLLNNRDGLMLGICNGFQALIKLGLVPYGDIRDMTEDAPTLTFNTIGRHISCLATTKIISNKSPWLYNCNVGDTHKIPFSHGEGRFVANEQMMKQLIENGQIATQYVDKNNNPTYDIKFNPNGSMLAIEGITSPDGRVFGKMGHSERIGNGLYKNVIGEKDQKIFEAGVNYFK